MKKESLNSNKYIIFLKAFILEILITFIFIAIFGAIMYFTETGFNYAAVFGTVSVAVGVFVAAFYAAKKRGSKGYLTGAIVGLITFFTVAIISLIVDDGGVTVNTLFHFIIYMLSALIGGVMGVNKNSNKKYI